MKLSKVQKLDEAMMAGGQEAYATEAKPDAYTRDQMAATSGFGRKPREHDTGDDEPAGLFTVVIDGRDWKTATSNEAFRMASAVARKHPGKRVQVRWPTGQLNTVAEALAMGMEEEFIGEPEHDGSTFKNSLHTIHRVAVYLNKNISDDDDIPEWVAEKMGAAKGMLTSVMQYLISEKEMHHGKSGMFEQGSLKEFAVEPSDGGDDDEYDLLVKLVKLWWLGTAQQHAKAEKTLASMGISIEEDDPNIILRRGKQFLTFPMDDFQQGVAEGSENFTITQKKDQSYPGSLQVVITDKSTGKQKVIAGDPRKIKQQIKQEFGIDYNFSQQGVAQRMPQGNYSDEAHPIRDDGNEPPDYAAMYESKLMEFAGGMGAGSVATAPGVGKGSNVGSLFGGSYSQKNSPFKKTKAKKESVIKR